MIIFVLVVIRSGLEFKRRKLQLLVWPQLLRYYKPISDAMMNLYM